MKKSILVFMMVLGVFTLKAQQADSTMVTVKDTTYKEDARLNYLVNTILPAATNFVDDYNRNQKVSGNTILLKLETNQLLRKIEKLVTDYSVNFMQVEDISIDPVQIVNEFNALNAKITDLQNDPEIKYIEAMAEFKRIKERQAVLANYYNQIQSQ